MGSETCSKDPHDWISFSPKQFKISCPKGVQKNELNCKVTVDTSKLLANSEGKRYIYLVTDTLSGTKRVVINVKTASIFESARSIFPVHWLLILIGVAALVPIGIEYSLEFASTLVKFAGSMAASSICPSNMDYPRGGDPFVSSGYVVGQCLAPAIINIIFTLGIALVGYIIVLAIAVVICIASFFVSILPFIVLLTFFRKISEKISSHGFTRMPYSTMPFISTTLGLALSFVLYTKSLINTLSFIRAIGIPVTLREIEINYFLLQYIYLISFLILSITVFPPLRRAFLMSQYRKREKHLIKL